MSSKLSDRIGKPRGFIRIFKVLGGQRSLHYAQENLILDIYREVLAHLLAEGDANYRLWTLKIGTAGHVTGDLYAPRPPGIAPFLSSRTTMMSEDLAIDPAPNPVRYVFSKSYNPLEWSYTYLAGPGGIEGVLFTVSILAAEANDDGVHLGYVNYTEAGFETFNTKLFSIKTFPVFVKNATVGIMIEWGFKF